MSVLTIPVTRMLNASIKLGRINVHATKDLEETERRVVSNIIIAMRLEILTIEHSMDKNSILWEPVNILLLSMEENLRNLKTSYENI